MQPSISIVIPTFNRTEDLKETLGSLIDQTVAADEIIIIDDSDNNETELLIRSHREKGKYSNLFYIRNPGENSICAARNAGIKMARKDIVIFLDDDVLLDRNYLLEILRVFESFPNAQGAQGWLIQEVRYGFVNSILRAVARAFYLGHTAKNECRIFPSTNVTYPHTLDQIISCEWLHGCNCALSRKVLEEFNFDEKLKQYTWKEDVDISYRIQKKYSGSLYITPKARLIHKEASAGRRPLKQTTYIKESYTQYIFFKDFDYGLRDRIIFIWSKCGSLLYLLFTISSRSIREVLTETAYWLRAQFLCIKNRNDIRKGDFQFLLKSIIPSVCMSNVLMWI